MEDFLLIVLAIVSIAIVVFDIVVIDRMVAIAAAKGYPEARTFIWWACLMTGILGFLFVVALPDKRILGQNDTIIELLKKNTSVGSQAEASLPPL